MEVGEPSSLAISSALRKKTCWSSTISVQYCPVRSKLVNFPCDVVYNQADSPNHKVEVTLALAAEDLYTYDISQHFEEAISFIEDQTRLGRNVLVHCHAGVSRSAAILAAFLIRNRRCSAEEAITFIRLKRPRAKPNEAFYHQLRNFAEKDQLISTDVSEQTTPTKDTIDTSPKKEEPPLLERISNWFSQATP